MRELSGFEERQLEALTARSIEVVLIEPTSTGLSKSILDATSPVRQFLSDRGIHDYSQQSKGPTHKEIIPCILLKKEKSIESRASLYRPNTKKGDPRIWFRALNKICNANDILVMTELDGQLYVFNLSVENVSTILDSYRSGPLYMLLAQVSKQALSVADELLERLKAISTQGYVDSIMDTPADTAVGRTLESLLGISINSSTMPDYKGIELKSSRAGTRKRSKTRSTLFAQVANWNLSSFKSSREILDAFGYQREDAFKLNCSVSTQIRNSQGLQLWVDTAKQHLNENSDQPSIGDFAVWKMDKLHDRLLEKHNETFWVEASARQQGGMEQFHYTKVLHTRKPLVGQFDLLLDQGKITLDHLIKRTASGRTSEKGPLFKIDHKSIKLLFPPSRTFYL